MTDFWQNSATLQSLLAEVEAVIASELNDPSYPLREDTARIVLSGGKMLRPALVLIGAGFGKAGQSMSRIVRIAASIELLHAATLIHDDVLDNADTRRGVDTLHQRWGATNAILAGDWLFSRCFRLIADNADTASARVLARFVGTICSAEIRQDLHKFSFTTTVREYTRTIAGKTAALFSLALHVGAREAKVSPVRVQALRRAGYNMGMAFQIIDDILDYESSQDVIRKPVGQDLREGLATLPLIYALAQDASIGPLLDSCRAAPQSAAPQGAAPQGAAPQGAVDAVLQKVQRAGALSRARADAACYTARARREIARLPATPARQELSQLLDTLLARSF